MKLHFDPKQPYQLDAIGSVLKVFTGQPPISGSFNFSLATDGQTIEQGIANALTLEESQILANLQAVQKENELPISPHLDGMHFSVEMETGTGKTYVYLRTIYELNQSYGFKKFVIVTPSVAIREGVRKNLQITHEHFQKLYNKAIIHFTVYDTKRISSLRNFYISNTIEILVINIDSFAKDENVINRSNDKLMGKKPIEFLQNSCPIVIADEPQNMETEIRKKAIESLNPLFTLRYSATHIRRYNMLYNLDPGRAYDLGLVKQIEVDSIVTENDFNQAYVSLESFHRMKTDIFVKLKIDVNDKESVKRKVVKAKKEDDLYELSNQREIYKSGYIINAIDSSEGFVEFSNGTKLWQDRPLGSFHDEIMQTQVEKTVKEHLLKEKKFKQDIKVLSLFFIDRVANYRSYDEAGNVIKGKLARWFEKAYKEISAQPQYKELRRYAPEQVHNGYFSQDKGRWKDTKGNTKADDDTFQLIMREKERLLSIDEPLRFIFSHSALREGWDNPNVFQICTLNETHSELKKRQEIGRGLRLAVNQNGYRIEDKSINCLTVIANESYEDFASRLQTEIEKECGVSFGDRIKDRKKRQTVRYRKGFHLDEKFKEIWQRVKEQTTYKVEYNSEELIKNAAKAVKKMPSIKPAKIKTTKTGLQLSSKGLQPQIKSSTTEVSNEVSNIMSRPVMSMPDLLFYIQKRTALSRSTIAEILLRSDRLQDALTNPQLFLDYSLAAIQNQLAEFMVDGIK